MVTDDPEACDILSWTRPKAVQYVLSVLRSPILLVSPERRDAQQLAQHYNISAAELLDTAREKARST